MIARSPSVPASTLLAAVSCCASFAPLPAQQLAVYVLAGQSNMQGHAKVSTFDYLADDPATADLLGRMRDERGEPRVCRDVWIAYRTGRDDGEVHGPLTVGFGARRNPACSDDKIGPEFTFGLRMAEAHDGPVLLIKAAWGGKSLHTDFRPPSAGPSEFREDQLAQLEKNGKDVAQAKRERAAATGRYYRSTIAFVQKVLADLDGYCPGYDAAAGYRLAGFVWFQGWNDMVARGEYPRRDEPGGYDAYTECLAHLIRDVRRDLEQPELPFVIGVMGVGGALEGGRMDAVHGNFRAAMAAPAAMPEFRGNVFAVQTAPFWPEELERIAQRQGEVQNTARQLRKDNERADAASRLGEDELNARIEALRAERLTDEDLATLRRGASNGGYHYHGCAKTMAQIGVAFAEALLERR